MSDVLILSTEKAAAPAASREALEAARRFSEDLGARGVLLDAERLRPSREG
ncbi:MAG: YciI family protein, partial [Deltaproteobacteria bacterium]|nr:YciI family protein [Deltaproteobacteria bacterium]